jgi:predicted enzyme related to lactoylglutathione lyase
MLVLACLAGTGAFAAGPRPELPPLDSDGQPHPGKFVWADLVTDNVPAAQTFYAGMFGWTFSPATGGDAVASNGGRPLGGWRQKARAKAPRYARRSSHLLAPEWGIGD